MGVWGTSRAGAGNIQVHLTSPLAETYPNVPQCLDITTVPLAQCQATYPEKVTENMLCAGGAQEGKDSCQVREGKGG